MSSTTSSPSISNIFPTATASGPSRDTGIGAQNPTTYYFVFLGVLVVLLTIAATLSLRAFRIRRRYRTATQLALMRGEPLPPMQTREEFWGFGAMAWRGDIGPDEVDRVMAAGGRRGKGKGVWEKVPTLLEAEVDEKGYGDGLEECLPVTLHSLLPRIDPEYAAAQSASAASGSTSPSRGAGSSRLGMSEIRRQIRHGPRHSRPADTTSASAATPESTKEIDRGVGIGEGVRVAIVIRMPRDPAEVEEEERRSLGSDALEYGDERPGWESGMELGVWEGAVGDFAKRAS